MPGKKIPDLARFSAWGPRRRARVWPPLLGPGETGGETQFSTTWGAGVKLFPAPNFGVRFGMQWTPTYIKSDPGGYWCDPYWGCYMVGDAQYSHQFQFNGGVTFRF